MSRKGNCLDNSIIENFWSILKREALNKKIYSLEELQKTVDKYIEYYNNERIKEKNEWQSPNEKRKKYYA